uniref:Uncharacterized protein n=1 Tax=Octopus bimaculoides TaxID=37653 RepID=A0A0L8IB94_OCTBM
MRTDYGGLQGNEVITLSWICKAYAIRNRTQIMLRNRLCKEGIKSIVMVQKCDACRDISEEMLIQQKDHAEEENMGCDEN